MDSTGFGKVLILIGLFIVLLGAVILVGGKIPLLGKLPGDIHIRKPGVSFHFPIVTCFLLSVLLTILLNLILRK